LPTAPSGSRSTWTGIEAEVGDAYGVDLIIPAKYAGDEGGGYTAADIAALIPAEHWEFVNDILVRYGVPELPDDVTRGIFRMSEDTPAPFSAQSADRSSTSPWPTGPASSPMRWDHHPST